MSNTEILCFILGWQGGTIHQVAQEMNVLPTEILSATPDEMRALCRIAQRKRNARP